MRHKNFGDSADMHTQCNIFWDLKNTDSKIRYWTITDNQPVLLQCSQLPKSTSLQRSQTLIDRKNVEKAERQTIEVLKEMHLSYMNESHFA